MERHGETRFSPWPIDKSLFVKLIDDDRPTRDRVGYRRQLKDGRTEYYIFSESWRTEVSRGCDARAVANELVRLGCIIPDKHGRASSIHRPPGFGRAVRFYRLTDRIFSLDVVPAETDREPTPREDKVKEDSKPKAWKPNF